MLGPRAHELRSHLGTTAWAVLEEMLERSTRDGDQAVAQVSIRSLATSLGLDKDTIGRAVRRLRDLGVIDVDQARTATGAFAAGSYRLAVPASCISIACPPQPSAASVDALARRLPALRRVSSPSASRSESPSRVRPSLRSSFKVQTGARELSGVLDRVLGATVLRVTTLYSATAASTAQYYTRYLTQADGELPGVWLGHQAAGSD